MYLTLSHYIMLNFHYRHLLGPDVFYTLDNKPTTTTILKKAGHSPGGHGAKSGPRG